MPEDTQGPRQRFPAGCGFSGPDGTARRARLARDRAGGRVMPPAQGGAYAHGVSDPVGAGSPGGGRPPTIYEVARQAGVSIATVSRVVSGASRVGDASRRRVEHAVATTGWVPDPAARQLAGAGGDVVVLAIGVADREEFAADPYYARVIAGAQEETARHGLSLAVQLGQRGSVAASGAWRRNRRSLGAVLVNVDAEEAAGLSGLGRPLVSMGRSGPSLPSVDPENEAGTAAAIQHLVNRGCRRIAMIAGPERNPCARERLAGYQSVMRSAGLPETVVSADFTRTGAAEATRLLLRATPGTDAVFAASDLMAAAALQVLIGSGRRVPDDVAVVGFDDSPPALMTTPALSTVRQPVEKLAALAVRTLLGPAGTRPPDQRMPTQLVVRASSAA
jgi:DNA-binding LacI/PurR family transcriptional regulator